MECGCARRRSNLAYAQPGMCSTGSEVLCACEVPPGTIVVDVARHGFPATVTGAVVAAVIAVIVVPVVEGGIRENRATVIAERAPSDPSGSDGEGDPSRSPMVAGNPMPSMVIIAPAAVVIWRPAPWLVGDPRIAVMRVAPTALAVRCPADAHARVPRITLLFVLPPFAVLAQLVDIVMDLFRKFGERYFAASRLIEIPLGAPLVECVAARCSEGQRRRWGRRLLGRLDEALLARAHKDRAFGARELRPALSDGQRHRHAVAHIDAIDTFKLRVRTSDGRVDARLCAAGAELHDGAPAP